MYECDVCHRRVEAQRVSHGGNEKNASYTRPDGWGQFFATAQRDSQKKQRKVDFCSEECLNRVYEDFYSEVYDD
jgi:hypothetical protein